MRKPARLCTSARASAEIVVDLGAFGERCVSDLPRLAIEIGRRPVRGQVLGVSRGVEQLLERLAAVVAAHEVMRQQRHALAVAVLGFRFEQQADALVDLAALLVQ